MFDVLQNIHGVYATTAAITMPSGGVKRARVGVGKRRKRERESGRVRERSRLSARETARSSESKCD